MDETDIGYTQGTSNVIDITPSKGTSPKAGKKPKVSRPFSCDLCSKRFTRSENLRRHAKQHSSMRFICPQCDKSYSRNDSLKIHMRKIHKSAKDKRINSNGEEFLTTPLSYGSRANSYLKKNVSFNEDIDEDIEDEGIEDESLPLECITKDMINQLLELYWFNFDPTFPILHKKAFILPEDYTKDILTNVICSIGLRYLYNDINDLRIADDIYSHCIVGLENALHNDFTIRYFQAALIAVYSGLFSGNDDWYKWSINFHFQLVSMARENGMFQFDGSKENGDWDTFITSETRKRMSYALYFIDGQMATLLNYPPKLSHYEIKHILPVSESLWEAENQEDWNLILHEKVTKKEEDLYFLEGLQQALIYGEVPKTISSFGAVVILLAIHIMIRNMAQYLGILEQRKSSSQDPFSRRSQLGQALNGLRRLIPKKNVSKHSDNTLRTMWDFFETDWNLAYIHLHLPDTVITSGIVEVTLKTTIVTAAALSKPQFDLLPGTVLLSNDYTEIPYEIYALVNSHILFFLKNFRHELKETSPAFTFMLYKGCLVTWQILKSSYATSSYLSKNDCMAAVSNSEDYSSKSSSSNSSVESKRHYLQKEYMMKRLADDILSHIENDSTTADSNIEGLDFFNKWVESLLSSYNIWGIGEYASISFREMLDTSDYQKME